MELITDENRKYFFRLSVKTIIESDHTTRIIKWFLYMLGRVLYFNGCWYLNVTQIYADECQFSFHVCMMIVCLCCDM